MVVLVLRKIFQKIQNVKNRNASIDFGEIQYERSLIDILIRVQFEEDSSKFTKIRVTKEIFQKTENPIKSQIGDQFL